MISPEQYEREIVYDEFCRLFGKDFVTLNCRRKGLISQRSRQIDILVENKGELIAVDTKFYNKNIDIKCVEEFIGMLQDLGLNNGLLVTNKGYTKSAYRRAHNVNNGVLLDIFSVDEIEWFQGTLAVPYLGKYGVVLNAPFGWVIDIKKNFLKTPAVLYRKVFKSLGDALAVPDIIYINFWDKSESEINNIKELITYQEGYIRESEPLATFEYLEDIRSDGIKIYQRIVTGGRYKGNEVTSFVDFEDYIFFSVLLSAEDMYKINLTKQRFITQSVLPIYIKQ